MGRNNPWAGLYDPSRITLRALRDLTSENINVGAQFNDWVKEPDVDSLDAIAPGQGATTGDNRALLNAAVLLLESSASLSANFLGKLLGMGMRMKIGN